MEQSAGTPRPLRFASFELDVRSGELRDGARRIRLQEQPFEILRTMLERPGEVVTRDELRRRLWPEGTFVDFEHGLNAAIKRLRAALGDVADNPRFVETLPRRGYRFIAKLDGAAERTDRLPSMQAEPQVRLVVLPFANLSGDPAQEYLSDGLTEELIAQVGASCQGQVGVIARWSSMAFKGTLQRARDIGKALQASHLLEGTVRCDGDRVRITARLIDATNETHLWSDLYDLDLSEFRALTSGQLSLSLQTDVALRVAGALAAELVPNALAPAEWPPTARPESSVTDAF